VDLCIFTSWFLQTPRQLPSLKILYRWEFPTLPAFSLLLRVLLLLLDDLEEFDEIDFKQIAENLR
jgi:hypothetical protein